MPLRKSCMWTSIFLLVFSDFSTCLPRHKRQDAPMELLSKATCLFLGGTPCANRIQLGSRQLDGGATFGAAQGLLVPILEPILGSANLGAFRGTQVDLGQPKVSTGEALDLFGIFQKQHGVRDVGLRGNGNYGASWGNYGSILGDLLGYGSVNDVNFNAERLRLDTAKRSGFKGIIEETTRTEVDPLSLKVNRVKETCYGRLFFGGKGICTEKNVGLGPDGT